MQPAVQLGPQEEEVVLQLQELPVLHLLLVLEVMDSQIIIEIILLEQLLESTDSVVEEEQEDIWLMVVLEELEAVVEVQMPVLHHLYKVLITQEVVVVEDHRAVLMEQMVVQE